MSHLTLVERLPDADEPKKEPTEKGAAYRRRALRKRRRLLGPEELPPRIQNKIRLPEGNLRTGCWIWTGAFAPLRVRTKRQFLPSTETMRTVVDRSRGNAMIRDKVKGMPVQAHRKIYGILAGFDNYDAVPRLRRCPNDHCVNPWHVREFECTDPTKPAPAPSIQPKAVLSTEEQTLRVMMSVRPATFLVDGTDFSAVELECNLTTGAVTPEIWQRYLAWDQANPEDDD